MAKQSEQNTNATLDDVANNAGARTAATNANPEISEEEARNANAGEGPNASGGPAPSTAEEHIPSTSDPYSTDLPSANMPNPDKAERRSQPSSNPNSPSQTPYVDREKL